MRHGWIRRGSGACACVLVLTTAAFAHAAPPTPPASVRSAQSASQTPLASSDKPQALPDTSQDDGPLAPLRFGGVAGAGVSTRPLDIEGMIKITRYVALGVDYGVLPTLQIGGGTLRASQIAGDFRIFPLASPFFFGVAGGYQTASAEATVAGESGSLTVSSPFVTPRVGWLWTWGPGVTLGFDAGALIPLHARTTMSRAEVASTPLVQFGRIIGDLPLPEVKLRVGFLL